MGQTKFDALFVYGVLYLIFIYLPVILIVVFSFNDGLYVAFPFKGATVEWYYQMMNNAASTMRGTAFAAWMYGESTSASSRARPSRMPSNTPAIAPIRKP